jgi:1-acyl-sn-glycerol-3-phosphate acyltransferase
MLFVAAMLLTVLIPLWVPLTLLADTLRLRLRFPLLRLMGFGLCWAWLETMGVLAAFGLWATGQRSNQAAHYRLQRWWASNLLASLGATCGIRVQTADSEVFTPGPTVLFVRHASLADSLVSAYVITTLAQLRPHYVLKRELLADPCLDIVGHRVPNYFLDRGADDSAPELAAIENLASALGERDVGVIFPEGTRANAVKRARALAKIAERDPARASMLAPMQHLLPPRPSGALAMTRGAPTADVVLAWHVGFEGLDTFGGIVRALARPFEPIRFVARRVPRAEVPNGALFAPWLDQQWLRMDTEVGVELAARQTKRNSREH